MLTQLPKRHLGVAMDIYNSRISDQLRQDAERYNRQYTVVTLNAYNMAHGRFLIIYEELYHIGHSLKASAKNGPLS